MTSALAPLAYKAQQDAIAQAPTAALMDEKLLTAVGDAKEGLAQGELQDNINRFNFEQNQPMQNLKDYIQKQCENYEKRKMLQNYCSDELATSYPHLVYQRTRKNGLKDIRYKKNII